MEAVVPSGFVAPPSQSPVKATRGMIVGVEVGSKGVGAVRVAGGETQADNTNAILVINPNIFCVAALFLKVIVFIFFLLTSFPHRYSITLKANFSLRQIQNMRGKPFCQHLAIYSPRRIWNLGEQTVRRCVQVMIAVRENFIRKVILARVDDGLQIFSTERHRLAFINTP